MLGLFAYLLTFVPNANFIVSNEMNRFYNILNSKNIPCHQYVSRVKTFNSAILKYSRKEFSDKSIYDLYDIVSFRFVFYNLEDLLKFYHVNRLDNDIIYVQNYIQTPKSNGYKAFHFHYKCNYDSIKRLECQLFVIEDYYQAIYGNASNYKDYLEIYKSTDLLQA
jgi:ppGpp synthetase/RelA/SpoT-type nucleotidyltranferase